MRGSRTLIDFCHGLWDTRIDSDVVSSDGYEVSNLISRDKGKKQMGFLAAGFVKPVVTILLSFPFPVDLYALNINPRVGAQKTCGLEIFAASLNARIQHDVKPNTIINTEDGTTQDLKDRGSTPRPRVPRTSNNCGDFSGLHHYQDDLNINNIKRGFKNLFVQILRVRIPEGNIGHFLNPCFPALPQVQCDSRIVGNASTNVQKCMLQQGRLLRRISHLVVRITQVHKGSVPCIGAVEVFGQPAQNSGTFVMNYATLISSRLKEEKQEVPNGLYTLLEAGGQAPCVSSMEGPSLATLTGTSSANGTSSLNEHVPEDFIDPITLTIMSLPVLLPSGTTIDQTTLERHIESEKSWGRPPSDPFTGLLLGSKVIPNAALKCRIDNFLLSSDVSVSNLGRTVGSLLDYRSTTKVKVNSIKKGSKLQKNYQLVQKISGGNKRTVTVNESDGSQAPDRKRQKTDDLDKALEEALNARRQPPIFNHNLSVSSLVKTYGSKSNEKKCDTDEISHAGCPHQGQDSILFQLPCQHVICRRCLTGAVENNQCPSCKRSFDKNNVARVHSIYANT